MILRQYALASYCANLSGRQSKTTNPPLSASLLCKTSSSSSTRQELLHFYTSLWNIEISYGSRQQGTEIERERRMEDRCVDLVPSKYQTWTHSTLSYAEFKFLVCVCQIKLKCVKCLSPFTVCYQTESCIKWSWSRWGVWLSTIISSLSLVWQKPSSRQYRVMVMCLLLQCVCLMSVWLWCSLTNPDWNRNGNAWGLLQNWLCFISMELTSSSNTKEMDLQDSNNLVPPLDTKPHLVLFCSISLGPCKTGANIPWICFLFCFVFLLSNW